MRQSQVFPPYSCEKKFIPKINLNQKSSQDSFNFLSMQRFVDCKKIENSILAFCNFKLSFLLNSCKAHLSKFNSFSKRIHLDIIGVYEISSDFELQSSKKYVKFLQSLIEQLNLSYMVQIHFDNQSNREKIKKIKENYDAFIHSTFEEAAGIVILLKLVMTLFT